MTLNISGHDPGLSVTLVRRPLGAAQTPRPRVPRLSRPVRARVPATAQPPPTPPEPIRGRAAPRKVMQQYRTTTQATVPTGLAEGELAINLASPGSPRMWVGVPDTVDPSGQREITGSAGSGAVSVISPITGDGTAGTPLALGTVPVNLGGTNATTAAGALDSLTGGSSTDTGFLRRESGTPGAWSIAEVTEIDGGEYS